MKKNLVLILSSGKNTPPKLWLRGFLMVGKNCTIVPDKIQVMNPPDQIDWDYAQRWWPELEYAIGSWPREEQKE